MRYLRPWCVVLGTALVCLGLVGQAQAHRVNVFAYVEGDTVHVECSYSRSDRVRFGAIEVSNAATNKVYLTGKTDDKGNFAFKIPPEARADKADLKILLRAGEGHQNDWIVKASEYLGAAPADAGAADAAPTSAASAAQTSATATATAAVPPAASAVPVATAPSAPAGATVTVLSKAELQAVVEAAVEKKIAPIRNILLAQEEAGPGLSEIAGGIGYLVGLAGLLAYARSRRPRA